MTIADKKDWPKLLKLYHKRSSSRAAFCKQHGVTLSTLDYHLRRVKSSTSFVAAPLVTGALETAGEIVLELPGGIKLTVRR